MSSDLPGAPMRVTWPDHIRAALTDQDQADAAAYQTLVNRGILMALRERDRRLEALAAVGCHRCGRPVTVLLVSADAQWFACDEHVDEPVPRDAASQTGP